LLAVAAFSLTTSQVNKAGQTVRRYLVDKTKRDGQVEAALEVIYQYRAAHQYPLIKANQGLRSVVRTEGCQVEVSQRLKRLPTILDKLIREPTMQLSTMQDIGGCRAVLGSCDEIRRVERRLQRNRPPLRYKDYITKPRESGYRGVHVVVGYADHDGTERATEVQLRTRTMHEWAITVERLSGRLDVDLKSGRGPDEVLTLLSAISEAMAIEEAGKAIPAELARRIAQLRQAAVPYLGRPLR
jgi:ppGpp synthetase/RelA/SpoT-type nucleotidyltranferase